jgi:hypothetical protein
MIRRLVVLALALGLLLAGSRAFAEDDPPVLAEEPALQQHGTLSGEATGLALSDTLFNPGHRLYSPSLSAQLIRLTHDASVSLPLELNLTSKLAAEWDHDATRHTAHVQLRELYLARSLGDFNVFLGRRILKWTNGYAFSPAGLLDPQRNPADPSDRLGRLGGRDLAQVDWFRGQQSISAVVAFPFRTQADGGDRVLAMRYDVLVHGIDIAVSAAYPSKTKPRGAVSVSYVLGKSLELHGEASAARGSDVLHPRATVDGEQSTLFGNDYLAPLLEDDGHLRYRVLAGANLTFPEGTNLIVEYYHTDDGLTPGQWDNFLTQSAYASELAAGHRFPPVYGGFTLPEVNLQQGLAYLRSQEIQRDYGFVRLARSFRDGRLQTVALALVNLHDRSFLVAPEATLTVMGRTSVYVRGVLFHGNDRSQYGNVAFSRSVTVGVRQHF